MFFTAPAFLNKWLGLSTNKVSQKTKRTPVKIDRTLYTEPSDWTFTDWTPSLISAALVYANEGWFGPIADCMDGLLEEDDRVGGALQQRRQGLTGLPLAFNQYAEGNSEKEYNVRTPVEEALDMDWTEICSEEELGKIIKYGLVLGACAVNAEWVKGTSGRDIPRLRAWNPKFLRHDFTRNVWQIQDKYKGWIDVDFENSSNWFLYTPFGKERPWNEGLWRRLALWVLAKKHTIKNWARYSEVHGFPTWIIETPESWTRESDRRKATRDFLGLGRDKAIALPKGVSAKIVEAVATNWQGFQQFISEANLAIIIAIMGQNLTSEVTKGAKASTVVHAAVANNLLKSDASTFSTFLHKGPFTWWTRKNFGYNVSVPWAEWDTAPPVDSQVKADTEYKQAQTAKMLSETFPDDFNHRAYLKDRKFPLHKPGFKNPDPPTKAEKNTAPSKEAVAPPEKKDKKTAPPIQTE